MHIVNTFLNDIEHTENNKESQKCKLSLVPITWTSYRWSFLSYLIISAEKNSLMSRKAISNYSKQNLFSHAHFHQIVTPQIISQIGTGLALQLVLTKVMARAMAIFLNWEVGKARKIPRIIKQKSWQFWLQILPYDIILLMTSLLVLFHVSNVATFTQVKAIYSQPHFHMCNTVA